ncbi:MULTISPECIES: acyltransferase [Lactobacillus]|uniref:Acyltransferase n=1 Tax=Lactobacillus xujianguonis TaxID=2495899 RepID=A0A437SVM1_9LACO|nr:MULTISPECIES: acyltransferase [Lactobacillus]RVU70942.1 acyltransferase [Lactobacillus xujianguonis]RVU73574.1 acyltransferase [Lactobacillus xujianguonis]
MKKRASNFELLRIISMFLIVLGHVTWQTKFNYNDMSLFHKLSIQGLWMGGELGVWCFTLISAYFLSGSSFKFNSLKKVWGLTLFYSITISLILFKFRLAPLRISSLLLSFFPVITGNYWYVSAYIGIYILVPYLNILINKLNKHDYQKFLLILFGIFSLLQYLKNITVITNNNSIVDLIYIYFVGGYIRKYSKDFTSTRRKLYFVSFLGAVIVMLISITVLDILKPDKWAMFLTTTSPFQVIAGISLFLIFKNMVVKYSPMINSVAASTFAVYLIHCQAVFLPILWDKLVQAQRFENVSYTIFIEILIAIIIYISATMIDYVRRSIFLLVNKYFVTKKYD